LEGNLSIKKIETIEKEVRQGPVNMPKLHFTINMIGKVGGGKTNAAVNIINMYQNHKNGPSFSDIYILSPTADSNPVWKEVVGYKKKDVIPSETVIADPIGQFLHITKLIKEKANLWREEVKYLSAYADYINDKELTKTQELLLKYQHYREPKYDLCPLPSPLIVIDDLSNTEFYKPINNPATNFFSPASTFCRGRL